MSQSRRRVKRDSRGRRTDRVKRREAQQMRNRAREGYTPVDIAKDFGRDLRTVKAHLELSSDAERAGMRADPELGPHRRGLFFFGQRLRDRLSLPEPLDVVKDLPHFPPLWQWRSRGEWGSGAAASRSREEAAVELNWGYSLGEPERHPLFGAFKQHLEGNPCWQQLQDIQEAYPKYCSACQELHLRLAEEYAGAGTGGAEESRVMASAALREVWHRVGRGAPFIIPAVSRATDDVAPSLPWQARFGPYYIRKATLPDAQEVAAAFQRISQEAALLEQSRALLEAHRELSQKVEAFRQALSPDDRLRKLLLQGRCDLYP